MHNYAHLLLLSISVLLFMIGGGRLAAWEQFQVPDDEMPIDMIVLFCGAFLFIGNLMTLYRKCDSTLKRSHTNTTMANKNGGEK